MTPTPDVTAAPSPATAAPAEPQYQVPTNREAREEWRQTGKLPSSEESAPSKENSAPPDEDGEKAAPASEAGNQKDKPKRDDANTRIRSLNAENKQLKERLAALEKGKTDVKAEPSPAPEKPKEQPKGLQPPVKPKIEEFTGENAWKDYEAARDQYLEDLADYKAESRLQKHLQAQREEATQRELTAQIDAASERYGAEARGAIGMAADAVMAADIPAAVKAIINDSDVMIDLLYTAGSSPDELSAFVALAKSNPSAAIRKVVLLEGLVKQELAKVGKPAAEPTAERDEQTGKFVSQTPKKTTQAPAIGSEVSGRGSPPSDPTASAVKSGDFRTFRETGNARDLAARQGR